MYVVISIIYIAPYAFSICNMSVKGMNICLEKEEQEKGSVKCQKQIINILHHCISIRLKYLTKMIIGKFQERVDGYKNALNTLAQKKQKYLKSRTISNLATFQNYETEDFEAIKKNELEYFMSIFYLLYIGFLLNYSVK